MANNKSINWIWPKIADLETAKGAARLGFWVAILGAVIATVFAVFKILDSNLWTLIDAAIFALIAWGINKMSRFAAMAGLTFYLIEQRNILLTFELQQLPLIAIFMLLYIHSIRGTFAYHKFTISKPKSDKKKVIKKILKPTFLEKACDNVVGQATLTGLAAFTGTPIAALLPVLSNSLASGRHKKRVEEALEKINKSLLRQEKQIKNISDAQYKIINETILTALQTTESSKILYLQNVITFCITSDISDTIASQLSRIIRDISSEEIIFLNQNIHYKRILFMEDTGFDLDLYIEPNSNESVIAAGLISLGLLIPSTPTIDNIGSYVFSKVSKKLLEMVTQNHANAADAKSRGAPRSVK